MGGLLLCSSRRGEKPYIIAESGEEIWSLEELCYYLYQNIYHVTEDFFSPELLTYLRSELALLELADNLSTCINSNRSFAEMIMMVCEAANYYDKEELLFLKDKLYTFVALSRPELLKLLADSYMEKQRYAQAIKRYEDLLSDRRRETCDVNFVGKVHHNMAVAYARMLMYHEAEEHFKKACELLSSPDSIRKELLLLYYLSGDAVQYKEISASFSEEQRKQIEEEWIQIRGSAEVGEGRREAVIENWKQEYRRQMS